MPDKKEAKLQKMISNIRTHAHQTAITTALVQASLLITLHPCRVTELTHQAICNGNQSQKGRQRINESVKVAKSEAQWITRILEKALIPVVAQALHYPTMSTIADQEAVALPIP